MPFDIGNCQLFNIYRWDRTSARSGSKIYFMMPLADIQGDGREAQARRQLFNLAL